MKTSGSLLETSKVWWKPALATPFSITFNSIGIVGSLSPCTNYVTMLNISVMSKLKQSSPIEQVLVK